jgi:hypothetical protein
MKTDVRSTVRQSPQKGHFAIRIPRDWFGEFAVIAKEEDEDYPGWPSYNHRKFELATLTVSQPTATVTIRLGPKAGVLIFTVADAITGAPLNPCVQLTWQA